jgi:parallel beta-helix repeat protein
VLGEVLTASVTPFNADGSVNFDKFRELANYLVDHGSDGIVVAGTTGESPTLSDDEKLELFAAAVDAVGARATVVAGTGSNDTGIYVGQSSNVVIEKNQTRDCTLGIEVENSTNIAIRENTSSDNSIGILVQCLPGLVRTATSDVSVSKNVLIGNNRPNPVTDPGDLLSVLPSGVGFFNVAGDRVKVRENIVLSNNSGGILVAQLPPALAALDPRINPLPDNNEIRDNVVLQNGRHPDPKLGPFPGSDLLWDFSGAGNCWASNVFSTAFPAPLPFCT